MAEKILALLGGDRRELMIVPALKTAGYTVRSFGLPAEAMPEGVEVCRTPREAAAGAMLLILPLPGVREGGLLHAPFVPGTLLREEDLAGAAAGTPVMVGVASAYLRGLCARLGLPLYEIAECDMVAVPNAVPTAEGAIQLAMQELPVTIDGVRALVLGFGRVGEALAARLRALGAEVTVANRGEARFARAARQGFALYPWANIADSFDRLDVIFNTAPSMVLDKTRLLALPRGVLVIDLASGGGGVDFAAAAELGIKAIHALSLPGRVAPQSAGRLLGRVYPELIERILAGQAAGDIENIRGAQGDILGKVVRI